MTLPHEAAILIESRLLRETIRVAEISLNRNEPDRLRGGSLDIPLPGTPLFGKGMEIAGWALPEGSGECRVQFLVAGEVRASCDLDVHRDDVFRHFGGDPNAEFCGFRQWVSFGSEDRQIFVEIILADGARVPLGVVSLSPARLETSPIRHAPGSLILMYHRIVRAESDPWSLAVDPANFAEQMEVLRREFTAVPLPRITDAASTESPPSDFVAVTFDDGYADNLSVARPILVKHAIPATVFLATGALGASHEFWWDDLERILLSSGRLPEALSLSIAGERFEATIGSAAAREAGDVGRERRWQIGRRPPGPRQRLYERLWRRLHGLDDRETRRTIDSLRRWSGIEESARPSHRTLRPEEVSELELEGLIDVGAHTVSHPVLSRLSVEAQRTEIETSAETLERLLGRRPRSFAYPYGDRNEETPKLLRAAGFLEAVTTAGEPVGTAEDPLRLPRIQVGNWDGDEFGWRLRQIATLS